MRNLVLISVILLCVGCHESRETEDLSLSTQKIEVDLNELTDELKMSEFFSEIEYLKLNTPNDKPIGRIRKIFTHDESLAFYDEGTRSIWIYSNAGEYKKSITIPGGRGPGEVSNINDVVLTKDGLIHALGDFKIVVYNLESEFVRETSFDFFIYKFTYLPNEELYVGYAGNSLNTQGNNQYTGQNLLFFNISGKIVDSAIPVPKGREHIRLLAPNNFPVYNDETHFFSFLSDTVYSIRSNQVKPKYVLDYGDRSIPEEVFERRENYSTVFYEWVDFMENEIDNMGYVKSLTMFNETSRFIHYRIGTGSNQYNVIHDKKSGETTIGPKRFTNDIDNAYVPFIYESSDSALYTIIEAGDLIRHLNYLYENEPEKYSHPNTQNLVKLARTISENNNPILQIATFKD